MPDVIIDAAGFAGAGKEGKGDGRTNVTKKGNIKSKFEMDIAKDIVETPNKTLSGIELGGNIVDSFIDKDTVIDVVQPISTEITAKTSNSATGMINIKNVKVNTKVSKVDSVKNATKNAMNKAQKQLDKKIENAMNQ